LGSGVGVAGRVVPELGEHPGTEDCPEAGLAQVDLSVRVPTKTRVRLGLQHRGLAAQPRAVPVVVVRSTREASALVPG